MAGDWIPVTQELPRKREVTAIAAATGMSRREVVGILVEFWLWAQAETADGEVPGVERTMLPHIIEGTTSHFWDAVAAVGWVTQENGSLVIPNAEKWIARGAKARLKKNQRQARWRNTHRAPPPVPKPSRTTRRPPADFVLTPARSQFGIEDGLDMFHVEREFAKFKDHAFAKGRAATDDWDATWRNWCRTATDRQHQPQKATTTPGRPQPAPFPPPKTPEDIAWHENYRAHQRAAAKERP